MKPFVYVTCPKCRFRISQPFPRQSGPVPFKHMERGCGARLLVTPDPERHVHSVRELGEQSFEDAIAQAYMEAA